MALVYNITDPRHEQAWILMVHFINLFDFPKFMFSVDGFIVFLQILVFNLILFLLPCLDVFINDLWLRKMFGRIFTIECILHQCF